MTSNRVVIFSVADIVWLVVSRLSGFKTGFLRAEPVNFLELYMGLTTVRECEDLNCKVTFEDEGGYLYIEFIGAATLSMLKTMPEFIIQHPEWYPEVPSLVDFRGCSTAGLSSDDIFELSEMIKAMDATLGGGNCAIVTSRELDYGLARMWQMMTEEHVQMDIDVFKDIDEARAWMLNL